MFRKFLIVSVSIAFFACSGEGNNEHNGGSTHSSDSNNHEYSSSDGGGDHQDHSSSSGNGGGNPPSPNNPTGAYLSLPSNANRAAIASRYEKWIQTYYITYEDDFAAGTFSANAAKSGAEGSARIKHSTANKTVSEGIGYGMLLASLNGDRERLDKLWKYNKLYRIEGTALMIWDITSFTRNVSGGSASDADIDIMAALFIAYNRWKDQAYLDDAIAIGKSIYETELSGGKLLLPAMSREALGDGTKINISYISLAAMKLLSIYDKGNGRDWDAVLNANISFMERIQNAGLGLFPDWVDPTNDQPVAPPSLGSGCSNITASDGTATSSCLVYNKESVRIPWRVAWYYHWFGDSKAKAMLDKMYTFVSSRTGSDPGQIKTWYGYNKDIEASTTGGKMYWTSLCATGLASAEHSAWNTACNQRLLADDISGSISQYYGESLYMLYFILFNGGFEF